MNNALKIGQPPARQVFDLADEMVASVNERILRNSRIEIRHIRYFLCVAEELNFTRAAKRLNTAQPSLSRQIHQLEQYIGGALFERTKRSVALTMAGKLFRREVTIGLLQIDRAVQVAHDALEAAAGNVSIALSPVAELGLFPRLLPRFRVFNPDINLQIRSMMPDEQINSLRENDIDAGFFCMPEHADGVTGLIRHRVYDEPLILALDKDHRLASKDAINLELLNDEKFILVSPEKTAVLHEWRMKSLKTHGLRMEIAGHADNILVALSMVAMGMGIAFMPHCAINVQREGLVYRPTVPSLMTAPLWFVHRNSNAPAYTRAMRALLQTVRDLAL